MALETCYDVIWVDGMRFFVVAESQAKVSGEENKATTSALLPGQSNLTPPTDLTLVLLERHHSA